MDYCKDAETYYSYDNIKTAIESCTKAIALRPNDGEAYFFRGYAFIKGERDWEQGIKDCTAAINLKLSTTEKLTMAYSNRGYALLRIGETDKATADFKKALEIYPNNDTAKGNLDAATNTKKVEAQIDVLWKEIEENPKDFKSYAEIAVKYEAMKRYSDAVKIIDNYIANVRTDERAFMFRGWFRKQTGDINGAFSDYDQAIKLNADNSMIYYFRAKTYEGKDNEKKIKDLKKAIELNPKYADPLWDLGLALEKEVYVDKHKSQQQKILKEAIDIFSRLINLDPKYDTRIYRFSARWHMALDPPDCKMAIENGKKAVEMGTSDYEFFYLADTYMNCRYYPDAIRTYEDVLSRKDSFFYLHDKTVYAVKLAKAWLLWSGINFNGLTNYSNENIDRRLVKKGMEALDSAIKISSLKCDKRKNKLEYDFMCEEKRDALAYKGVTQVVFGDYKMAVENLNKSLELFDNPSLRSHLAEAHYRMGNYSQALLNCKKSRDDKSELFGGEFGIVYCTDDFINRLEKDVMLGHEKVKKKSKK